MSAPSTDKPRRFKNPLLQATESPEGAATPQDTTRSDLATAPSSTGAVQGSLPGAEASEMLQPRLTAFEQSHVRMTSWVDRTLKARLDALVREQQGRTSRSRLLNEAIADLLRKYKAN